MSRLRRGETVFDAPQEPIVHNGAREQDADTAGDRGEDGEPPCPDRKSVV